MHDPEHDTLTCVLMNKSNFGADEEIGRAKVRSLLVLSSSRCPPGNAACLHRDLPARYVTAMLV